MLAIEPPRLGPRRVAIYRTGGKLDFRQVEFAIRGQARFVGSAEHGGQYIGDLLLLGFGHFVVVHRHHVQMKARLRLAAAGRRQSTQREQKAAGNERE